MISEFLINVSDNQINDLHKRIQQTRWPDEINDQYWSHGTKMSFLKDLSKYWVDEFNWKDQEKKINDIGSFKFKTNSGLSIHFLHAKSDHKDAVPLFYFAIFVRPYGIKLIHRQVIIKLLVCYILHY